VHAIRPIVRGGEVWIAAGFGLMHGLAFAALLGALDLGRGSLIGTLLGFNLGIELTQLLVVALVMPSLMVLSRSRAYPAVRTGLAGLGIVLALGWLAERTTLIGSDPLDDVAGALVTYPYAVPIALALAAGVVIVRHRRAPPSADRAPAEEAEDDQDPVLSPARQSWAP
jgi:hypothetical protein